MSELSEQDDREALIEEGASAILYRISWPSLHWPKLDALHNRDVRIALARAVLEVAAPAPVQVSTVEGGEA